MDHSPDTPGPVSWTGDDGYEGRHSWLKQRVRVHAYVPEALILVGVMAVLNLGLMPGYPGFIGITPHPFWAVILLMATRYGARAGVFASLLCAGGYYALIAGRVDVITYRDLVAWQYAKPAVLFLVVGVIAGMLVQRHKDRIAALEAERAELVKETQQLEAGERELRDVNVELASRVVNATETLPLLYKYAKQLNTLDLQEIYVALTALVGDVLNAEKVSAYELRDGQLLLHSQSGKRFGGPELELRLHDTLHERLVGQCQLITLHDLMECEQGRRDLFLAGPLRAGEDGELLGVLAVEKLDFLRYNEAGVRLFTVVLDWATACLAQAARFRDNPAEAQLQQNRVEVLREQRAKRVRRPDLTADHMVLPASLVARASATRELHSLSSAAALSISSPPRTRNTPALSAGLSPAAEADQVAEGLADVLSEASDRLFGGAEPDIAGALHADIAAGATGMSHPAVQRGALQRMLSEELSIARAQGTPLAKLLAEIDGYVSGK